MTKGKTSDKFTVSAQFELAHTDQSQDFVQDVFDTLYPVVTTHRLYCKLET